MSREADCKMGHVHRLSGVLEHGILAGVQEILAETPGMEALVLSGEVQPFLLRVAEEAQGKSGSLSGFEHGHHLAPMSALFLQTPDLVAESPAHGTTLYKVGRDLAQDFFMLHLAGQPARQRLQRQVIVRHGSPFKTREESI